jgi:hypothetical protein
MQRLSFTRTGAAHLQTELGDDAAACKPETPLDNRVYAPAAGRRAAMASAPRRADPGRVRVPA